MKPLLKLALVAGSLLTVQGSQGATLIGTPYNVPSTANIFSAGLSVPVAPGGNGAGTLPVQVSFSAAFQFEFISGTVSPYYSLYSLGPEGLAASPVNIDSYGGVSGYISDWAFSFAGVFLSDAAPQDPAPARLDFSPSGLGRNFLTLAPEIGQVFFIGNGMTDGGTVQTFYAPAGATRLFIGFPDCQEGLGYPGSYADNVGSLRINVASVPEPGAAMLFLSGLAVAFVQSKPRKAGPGR